MHIKSVPLACHICLLHAMCCESLTSDSTQHCCSVRLYEDLVNATYLFMPNAQQRSTKLVMLVSCICINCRKSSQHTETLGRIRAQVQLAAACKAAWTARYLQTVLPDSETWPAAMLLERNNLGKANSRRNSRAGHLNRGQYHNGRKGSRNGVQTLIWTPLRIGTVIDIVVLAVMCQALFYV